MNLLKLIQLQSILIVLVSECLPTSGQIPGLSQFRGSMALPMAGLEAMKLVNGVQKLLPTNSKDIVSTTFKAIGDYSPIQMPQEPEANHAIRLDDKELQLVLPSEKVEYLIKVAGLDSKNIEWQLYRCPISLSQLRGIVASKSTSTRLSILSIDKFLPKILSNIDRFSDSYFRILDKYIDSQMDQDEYLDYVEKLKTMGEGLVVLPVTIKHGALEQRPGSIVLLGICKTELEDKSVIIPVILVGSIKYNSIHIPVHPAVQPVIVPEPEPIPQLVPAEPYTEPEEESVKVITPTVEEIPAAPYEEPKGEVVVVETPSVAHGHPIETIHIQYRPSHHPQPSHYPQHVPYAQHYPQPRPQYRPPPHAGRPINPATQPGYYGHPVQHPGAGQGRQPVPRPRMAPRKLDEQSDDLEKISSLALILSQM